MRKNRPYLSKKRTVVRTHRFGVKQRGDVQYFFCHAKDINVYLKTTWGLGEAQNQAHHSLAPLLYQLAFLVNLPNSQIICAHELVLTPLPQVYPGRRGYVASLAMKAGGV